MSLIALGVTGGIGAYKAVEVCRGLQQQGHDVVAVMTRAATRFVGAAHLRGDHATAGDHVAVAAGRERGHRAHCDRRHGRAAAGGAVHGERHRQVRATASPTTSSSSLYLATTAPVLLAPAMNSNMLAHDAVQRNLAALRARGVQFVEPGEGYLACGWIGKGPPRGAGRYRPRGLARRAASGDALDWRARVSSSPPVRPTKTSIRCATSATGRAGAWGSRWPPRRAVAART